MRERVTEVLKQILDPDLGVNIVDLGLIERVDAEAGRITVDLIMTSPACPQADYLADQSTQLLQQTFGAATQVSVAVVDYPPWGPERMSDAARRQLGWAP